MCFLTKLRNTNYFLILLVIYFVTYVTTAVHVCKKSLFNTYSIEHVCATHELTTGEIIVNINNDLLPCIYVNML